MQPLLAASASIKPKRAEIVWTRDAFLDLLRIRASSSLFRLRSADEVQRRLRFHNTGLQQQPGVIAGQLDGVGLPGANFRELLYLVNASTQAQTLTIDALKDKPFVLHPVHRAPGAADTRAATATADSGGRFNVPARTAVVFVVP